MVCVVQLNHLGGALSRPPAVPDAITHRDTAYLLRVLSPLDGTDVGSVRSVHAALMDAVAGTTVGRSPGFVFGEGAM